MNNFAEFLNVYNNLRNNFNGNPKEVVEKIIAQNNISQQELNMLQTTANQIMKIMK